MSRTEIDPSLLSPIIPINKGGTNSSTALSNNYLISSQSGAIAESTAVIQPSVTISTNTVWTGDRFIPEGTTITVNSGKTLTITGTIEAGAYPIFTGSGSVVFGNLTDAQGATVLVEWFGAVGDNSTDDTTAIQNAINSLISNGTVLLQDKIYVISSQLTISTGNVGIQGQLCGWFGGGGSQIRQQTSNTSILSIAGASTSAQINSNFLKNVMLLHGTSSGDDTNTSGIGLTLANTVRCQIQNVTIAGCHIGISCNFAVDTLVNNFRIFRIFTVPTGTTYGIYFTDDGTHANASNTFRDGIIGFPASKTGTAIGVYYDGAALNDLYFEGIEIDQSTNGYSLTVTGAGDLNYDVKIDRCVIDGYLDNGIYLNGFNENGGITIMNGWFAPSASASGTVAAININSSSGVKVIGAEFVGVSNITNTSGYGILTSTCNNCIFSNNTINGYYNPIGLFGTTFSTFIGNSILNISGQAANDMVAFTGSSNYNTFTANILNGYATNGIVFNSGNNYNTIADNQINSANMNPISDSGTGNIYTGNIGFSNSSVSLTSGVTGTLPVANGGTGVTASTGTGNVVLSASPTFTGTISATALSLSNIFITSELASTTSLANALNSNLVIPTNSSFFDFAGGGASCQLGGMIAGTNGQKIVILNLTGSGITIIGESSSSTAANRIWTAGLAACTWNNLGSREFIYSGNQSRWLLIGSVAA